MLYGRSLLIFYSIYICVFMFIPTSLFILPPLPSLLFGNRKSVFSVCESVSLLESSFYLHCSNSDFEPLSMFFLFFKQFDSNIPVEMGFLKVCPLLNSFLTAYPREFIRVRYCLQPLRPCEYSGPRSWGFNVVVMGNGHKMAALSPAQLWVPVPPEPEGKWVFVV